MYPNFSGQVFGQYKLDNIIGRGGMAVVYRARQTNLERDVAIKIISAQALGKINLVARFKREADLIARLEHPHILPIYDYGEQEDYLYLVVRLMDGGSLDQRIQGHPLPLEDIDRLTNQIAGALDYAHSHEVVHRDLKPNNILLDTFGNAYLMDFGIAKILSATHLTSTSTLMGTPAYMAPEQWRMETVDHRADIYSMGVILYEMVTGQVPFDAPTPHQLMYAHLNMETPRPSQQMPGLLPSIDAIILKATAKAPADRYQSAKAMSEALSQAIKHQDVDVRGDLTPLTLRPIPKSELHSPTTENEGSLLTQQPIGTPGANLPPTATYPLGPAETTSDKQRNWLPFAAGGVTIVLVIIILVVVLSPGSSDDKEPNVAVANQPTATVTSSQTPTSTTTVDASATFTSSPSSTSSATLTVTTTPTETVADTATTTPSSTPTASPSLTRTVTITASATATATPSITPSLTATRTPTALPTNTPFLLPGPTATSAFLCPGKPASIVSVGIRARTTFIDGTTTRLRAAPDGEVVEGLPEGFEIDIVGGPICTNTFTWWQVRIPDGTIGWMAEADAERYYIEPAPGYTLPTLRVLQIGPNHRAPDVRTEASNTSSLIITLSNGDRLLWDGRLIANEGLSWAIVTTYDGRTGYIIYRPDWITELNPRTTTPGIAIDRTVRVSSSGNLTALRTSPDISASTLFAIPSGTTMTVSDGPVFQDYFVWWQFDLANGTRGWMPDRPGWFAVAAD